MIDGTSFLFLQTTMVTSDYKPKPKYQKFGCVWTDTDTINFRSHLSVSAMLNKKTSLRAILAWLCDVMQTEKEKKGETKEKHLNKKNIDE